MKKTNKYIKHIKRFSIMIVTLLLSFTIATQGVHALDLRGFDEDDFVRGVADVVQYTPLNTSTDSYQGNGPFDTYSAHILYYDLNHVGPTYFFFGNDINDNYNFPNVLEMGFFNFMGQGSLIAENSLEYFKYNNVLDNYRAPYVVQNDTTKANSSFYGMALLSPVNLTDIGFYIMIDTQIGSIAVAQDYATDEIIPYIYRADSIGLLHPQYEQNIWDNGYISGPGGYFDGFNDGKETYGMYYGNSWRTAEWWGDTEYNRGIQVNQSEAYDEGYSKGSNDSFLGGLKNWIVPAIIVVLFLGGAVTIIAKKREG